MAKKKEKTTDREVDSRINVKLRTPEEQAAYKAIKKHAVDLDISVKALLLYAGLQEIKNCSHPNSPR